MLASLLTTLALEDLGSYQIFEVLKAPKECSSKLQKGQWRLNLDMWSCHRVHKIDIQTNIRTQTIGPSLGDFCRVRDIETTEKKCKHLERYRAQRDLQYQEDQVPNTLCASVFPPVATLKSTPSLLYSNQEKPT